MEWQERPTVEGYYWVGISKGDGPVDYDILHVEFRRDGRWEAYQTGFEVPYREGDSDEKDYKFTFKGPLEVEK